VRVVLMQIASPDDESIEDRRQRVADLLRNAPSADLYMLPELWTCGFLSSDKYAVAAETMDGPTISMIGQLARERDAYVHAGSIVEQNGPDQLRNTAVIVDPDGQVVHSYSKIHGFGHDSSERDLLVPGDHVQIAPTRFGRVASTTCYDLRFPGLWERIADGGADVVFVPAAWPAARVDHWRLFTSARAVEAQAFVIACNAVGEQSGVPFGGHSRVVDPWGEVLLELGDGEEVGVIDIDPRRVSDVRERFPVLQDKLADYSQITVSGAGR